MYAILELRDRTGSIEAVAWDNVVESLGSLSTGDVVFISGTVNEYNNRLQIVVQSIRRTDDTDIDPKDFLPETEENTEKIFDEIVQFRKRVKNPHLISLLDAFFKDFLGFDLFFMNNSFQIIGIMAKAVTRPLMSVVQALKSQHKALKYM